METSVIERAHALRGRYPTYGARGRLQLARAIEHRDRYDDVAEDLLNRERSASDDWDGFRIVATLSPDYDDIPGDGYFTNTWSPGALYVLTREGKTGRYRWFVPAVPASDHYEWLHGHGGMARGPAHDEANRLVRDEMERARGDQCEYWVKVTAYREGIELGSASLSGIDLGDIYDYRGGWDLARVYVADVLRELVPEAIAEAQGALARLCAGR